MVNAKCQIKIMPKLLLVHKALLSDSCFILEMDKKMRRKKMKRNDNEKKIMFLILLYI